MHTFAQKPKATKQTTSAKSTVPSRAHIGQSREVNSILHLQRTLGNQAMQRMLRTGAEEPEAELTGPASPRFGHDFSRIPIHPPAAGAIQTKLAINKLGDSYVQEADPMTEQVMRTPEPQLQRKCACGSQAMAGGECSECDKKKRLGLQTKLTVNEPGDVYEREADRVADQVMATHAKCAVGGAPPRIQRFTSQPTGQTEAAPASVDGVLASSGTPLAPALRQDMEQRFGHDFSRVRVHSDAASARSARDVNAHAYTVGNHVVFGVGKFAPESREGGRLLAHELTHVVQQSEGAAAVQRQPTSGGSAGGHELTDAELLALANLSPVRVEGSSDERFEEVLVAANNGLIDIVTPAEFERQLRFRVERLGSAEFARAWTDEERFSFAEAGADERKAQLAAKWASFIEQGYMAYLADKAAQWRSATRRMHTAAVIGNVIGEVTVTAATLFIGGGGGLGAARGGGGTALARETSKTILKREVEAVARRRAAEFADKAARLATKVVLSPDTDKDKRRKKCKDICEDTLPITWPSIMPLPPPQRPLVRTPSGDPYIEPDVRSKPQRDLQEEINEQRERHRSGKPGAYVPRPCFKNDADPNDVYDAHHMHPLYLGGAEDEINLCALRTDYHQRAHPALNDQKVMFSIHPVWINCKVCSPRLPDHLALQEYEIFGGTTSKKTKVNP